MDLIHYECLTAAGEGPSSLFKGLIEGIDHSKVVTASEWSREVIPGGRACLIPRLEKELKNNFKTNFENDLAKTWQRLYQQLSSEHQKNLKNSKTLVILSSTKGLVEDIIWPYQNEPEKVRTASDPLSPLLTFFKNQFSSSFGTLDTIAVSNACASSHVAFEVAASHLRYELYDYVLVMAADLVGPFIYQGFQALKVLSSTLNRPFSSERDGLQLGEAVAFLLFTKTSEQKNIKITSVASDTEGGSVTKPSTNGESLLRALQKVSKKTQKKPDLVIAHGTGTRFNDAAEEQALSRYLASIEAPQTPITSIKWSVGHTLGASGALDVIIACEILKTKKVFEISNSLQKDLLFKNNYIIKNTDLQPQTSLQRLMVTSLGFGGVHAALMIEMGH